MARATKTIFLLSLMTLVTAKPIMVTFGTKQGPIRPPTEPPQLEARNLEVRAPAPVSEETEDTPNPNVYKAPVPRQYRNRIFTHKPQSNLILGTPIDQKYTPTDSKYDLYKKQNRASIGTEYTGPHFFERQDYEIEAKRQPVRYIKPHHYDQKLQQRRDDTKTVPQIGIIYSAGVRYYVPQLAYDDRKQDEEQENSVYDSQDEKYLYRSNQ